MKTNLAILNSALDVPEIQNGAAAHSGGADTEAVYRLNIPGITTNIGDHAAANSGSHKSHSSFTQSLSAYATGWRDQEGATDMLNFIAPQVPVGKGHFEYKAGMASDANLLLDQQNLARGRKQDFPEISHGADQKTCKVENYGLMCCYDIDTDDYPGIDEDIVAHLLGIMERSALARAISVLADNATVTAADIDWSGENCNPDKDLKALRRTAKPGNCGMLPNRILFSGEAWDGRSCCYDGQNNAAANARAGYSLERLAGYLNMRNGSVIASELVGQTRAGTEDLVDTNKVFTFYAQQSASRMDSSAIKRFVFRPSRGSQMRVHRWDSHGAGKLRFIAVESYETIKATAPDGICCANIILPDGLTLDKMPTDGGDGGGEGGADPKKLEQTASKPKTRAAAKK